MMLKVILDILHWISPKLRFKICQKIRNNDPTGGGSFGDPRGGRSHKGIDLLTSSGEPIFAPFDLTISRYSRPYSWGSLSGVEFAQADHPHIDNGYIWYLSPSVPEGARLTRGELIGYAQDVSDQYRKNRGIYGMQNHLHFEAYDANDALINPTKYLSV